jgi:hypothetical protein
MAQPEATASGSKRKAPRKLQKIGRKRTKTTISKAHIKFFRLFDLPAELRNVVYEKIAEEQSAQIRSPTLLISDYSGLLKAGPQLHDEYLPILILHASKIEARVNDFNFGPLVTVLNKLSHAEISALPTVTRPGTRRIEVQMVVSCVGKTRLLRRWLNRAGHGNKKGTMLDISYTYNRSASNGVKEVKHWAAVLDAYVKTAPNKRAAGEARKIKAALETPI